jgi:uncharacterized membrane protein
VNALNQSTTAQPWKRFVITVIITGFVIAAALVMGRTPQDTYVTPQWAVMIHLLTVIPALPLGAYVIFSKKGDATHRLLGKIWAALMLVTSIDSFWIREVTGHIGPIHIFSAVTLISLPLGIYAIHRGNVEGHRRAMRGTFIGLCAAGLFALMPGRMLGSFLFGHLLFG